jgi:tetratricopeptide (TPR) repeat protein
LLADGGRAGEALTALGRALDAGEGEAAIAMGLIHRDRGDDAAAEEAFRRGTALEPAVVAPYLGVLLRDSGRADEEVALYRSVLDTEPDAADVLLNLANVLRRGSPGDAAEAEALYRRAAEAGEREAFHNLGLLLEDAGRLAEARAAYARGAAAGDDRAAARLAELDA